MDRSEPPREDPDPEALAYGVAEYTALRAEILKQMDLQHQVATFALVVLGVLVGAGLHPAAPRAVLLAYPILGAAQAAWYARSYAREREAALYLRDLETRVAGLGWEGFQAVQRRENRLRNAFDILGAGGLFVVAQALALGLASTAKPGVAWSEADGFLAAFDTVMMVVTVVVLIGARRYVRTLQDQPTADPPRGSSHRHHR